MSDFDFKLDPNRYAQSAELQVLEAHLALDAETLDALESRTTKAAAILRDAEQRAGMAFEALASARALYISCTTQPDDVQERRNYARGLMHPIRRLPGELLEAIMLIAITDVSNDAVELEDSSFSDGLEARRSLQRLPYRLAAVSRGWRHTAILSPSLWVYVVLNFDDICASTRWKDATATKGLVRQLARASQRDLTLLVDGDPNQTDPVSHWFSQAVWIPEVLCRLIRLQMCRIPEETLHGLRASGIGPSRLLTADFHKVWPEDRSCIPAALLNWMASSVKTLRCYSSAVAWSSLLPMPALRSLESGGCNHHMTFKDFAEMARRTPNITELGLWADMIADDGANSQTIEFNDVQHLWIGACMSRAVCTALRFPNITTAKIGIGSPTDDVCALLLQHGVASFGTNHLRSLSLYGTEATQALADVFYDLKLVEDLHISSGGHTKEFCAAMSRKDGHGRWALPRMTKLDIQSHRFDTRGRAERPILQMISRRQELSRVPASGLATLVHCVVHYACDAKMLPADFDDQLQKAISAGLPRDP